MSKYHVRRFFVAEHRRGRREDRAPRTGRRAAWLAVFLAVALLWAAPALAAPSQHGDTPTDDELLNAVAFDQNLDAQIPLDVALRNEMGQTVRLGDLVGARPVVMAFAYYDCPNLCPLVLNGLVASLRSLNIDVGKDFDVVVVSIDPRETPELATATKAVFMSHYGRYDSQPGWHFLTGQEESIAQLAKVAGFHYAYDEKSDEYAHPTGVLVLTPQGKISKYLYGLEFSPRDLRLALVDASSGKIGSAVDQLLLRCFHYDPERGKYTVAVLTVLRLAGAVTALALGGMILALVRIKPLRPISDQADSDPSSLQPVSDRADSDPSSLQPVSDRAAADPPSLRPVSDRAAAEEPGEDSERGGAADA